MTERGREGDRRTYRYFFHLHHSETPEASLSTIGLIDDTITHTHTHTSLFGDFTFYSFSGKTLQGLMENLSNPLKLMLERQRFLGLHAFHVYFLITLDMFKPYSHSKLRLAHEQKLVLFTHTKQ